MANFLPLNCRNCEARYAVPDAYKPHIEGRMVLCPECRRSWIPMPGSRDGAAIEASKVDLRRFRLKPGQEVPQSSPAPQPTPGAAPVPAAQPAPAAQAAPAAQPPNPASASSHPGPQASGAAWNVADAGSTVKIPTASMEKTTLRVSVQGPGANLTGVFELGEKRFVIGRTGCHLRLPKAAIPDHAIEVRSAPGGFIAEGIGGFPLILGAISAPSAMIMPGQSVKLSIIPYQLEFQTSNTPGSPVKDLAEIQPIPTQAPQPIGPAPAAHAPPAGAPAPTPQSQPAIQALAADVSQEPNAFGGGSANLLDQVGGEDDGDMTIADMGAMGLNAQSQNVDPLKGLEVCLVRADGPEQGQRFTITKTPLIVGRSQQGLQIRDKRVSSKHAQLDVSGPWVYTLKDLASTNGTMVNGRPISVAQLGDGDLVSFGGVTFTFKAQKR